MVMQVASDCETMQMLTRQSVSTWRASESHWHNRCADYSCEEVSESLERLLPADTVGLPSNRAMIRVASML